MTNPEKYEELLAQMKQWGCAFKWVTFPNLRSYLVAPKGFTIFSRDYSQQEFRMLAHHEGGILAQAYNDDPDLDLHVFVMELINETTGIGITRKPTKTINFGKVYGMGAAKLAASLKVDVQTGYSMLEAYDRALPSVKELMKEVGSIGKDGKFITTLGGRRYYSPPASIDEDTKHVRTFEYKLLNYLMQGGSADQTKEAMRIWWDMRLQRSSNGTRFLMSIHDQLVGIAPTKDVKKESKFLNDYMVHAFELDVPTKTDPTYGKNFGAMK
jgi:DNA polymerase-1